MGNDTQKLRQPVAANRAGSVVIDERGRNVWQWKDTQIDSTSIVLKRLENDALQLESTRKVPIPRKFSTGGTARGKRGSEPRDEGDLSLSATISYKVGDGFDPYNRS